MFITFLVLGSLVFTLKQAGTVKSNTKNLDQITEAIHTLVLIKSDIRAALEIPEPSSGSSSTLIVSRVNPELKFEQRLDSGNLFNGGSLVTISYSVSNGILLRQFGANRSERLIKVSSFEARRTADLMELTIEVENSRVQKSHTMKVAID